MFGISGIVLVAVNTVFGLIIFYLFRFKRDRPYRIPVSNGFFIYCSIKLYYNVIEIFLFKRWGNIIVIKNIQEITNSINAEFIKSKIYYLVFRAPDILCNRSMYLPYLKCVKNFEL